MSSLAFSLSLVHSLSLLPAGLPCCVAKCRTRERETLACGEGWSMVRRGDGVLHMTRGCNTPQYAALHCNTLQHIETHCNTLLMTRGGNGLVGDGSEGFNDSEGINGIEGINGSDGSMILYHKSLPKSERLRSHTEVEEVREGGEDVEGGGGGGEKEDEWEAVVERRRMLEVWCKVMAGWSGVASVAAQLRIALHLQRRCVSV